MYILYFEQEHAHGHKRLTKTTSNDPSTAGNSTAGGDTQTNQLIHQLSSKSHTRHTSTREAVSQHHHMGSKPCVAKHRRLGGLRTNRASVSLRDSLKMCTLSTEARETSKFQGKPPHLYQLPEGRSEARTHS